MTSKQTQGVLIAVVGPSGVGKDSLMQGARASLPGVHFMQRMITRPADAGGEDHIAVTDQEFLDYKARGQLLFDWQAHGLRYGIPIQARSLCQAGQTVIFNGSRNALAEQQTVWPELKILWVTANPDLRASRLASRGREDAVAVAARLAREAASIPPQAVTVENEGTLAQGIQAMVAAITVLSDQPNS